jgi:hypothetical protein
VKTSAKTRRSVWSGDTDQKNEALATPISSTSIGWRMSALAVAPGDSAIRPTAAT